MRKRIFILIIIGLYSCSYKDGLGYENEEVLMKYINSRDEFSFYEAYSIVTVKSKTYCSNCMPDVRISDVIIYIQTVNNEEYKNERIFIVTDGILPNEFTNEFLNNKNIQIIVEETTEMQRYGLYHTHIHWFYIKKNKINDWKCFVSDIDFAKE